MESERGDDCRHQRGLQVREGACVKREVALHRSGDVTHHVLGVVMVKAAELYADAVAEPLEAL